MKTGGRDSRRICALHGAESHTTGRYLVSAARARGYEVDVHVGGRKIERASGHGMVLYVDPGPPVFPLDIDRSPGIRVAYLIDVHQELKSRLELAPLFDLVFVAQRDYVEEFRSRGFLNTAWLPLACDPAVHTIAAAARDIDVGFVGKLGSRGSRRHAVLQEVLSRFRTNHYRAFHSPEEMGRIYGRSRIVFNASINGDVNMRVFEALASGALLVTDRIDNGLSDLFVEGEHYVGYSSPEEAIERIGYFLEHAIDRERIAKAGQALALERHTYAARWSEIEKAAAAFAKSAERKPPDATRALTYAHIFESRRDPVGILHLIARSGPSAELGAALLRATARVVNSRVPLTPGALRARFHVR